MRQRLIRFARALLMPKRQLMNFLVGSLQEAFSAAIYDARYSFCNNYDIDAEISHLTPNLTSQFTHSLSFTACQNSASSPTGMSSLYAYALKEMDAIWKRHHNNSSNNIVKRVLRYTFFQASTHCFWQLCVVLSFLCL